MDCRKRNPVRMACLSKCRIHRAARTRPRLEGSRAAEHGISSSFGKLTTRKRSADAILPLAPARGGGALLQRIGKQPRSQFRPCVRVKAYRQRVSKLVKP